MKHTEQLKEQFKKTNETIIWYDSDTWHCQKCNTYIDDKTEEMEMHECKQQELA
jgi:hypothetical protein